MMARIGASVLVQGAVVPAIEEHGGSGGPGAAPRCEPRP